MKFHLAVCLGALAIPAVVRIAASGIETAPPDLAFTAHDLMRLKRLGPPRDATGVTSVTFPDPCPVIDS